MVKILVGILLIPLIGWASTQLPLPDTLPGGIHDALFSIINWVWALNQILPMDTLFLLAGIALAVEFSEMIVHLVSFMIKIIKQ